MKVFFAPIKMLADDCAIQEGSMVRVVVSSDECIDSAKMYTALATVDLGGDSDYVPIQLQKECTDMKIENIDRTSAINPRSVKNHYLCPRNYIWSIER